MRSQSDLKKLAASLKSKETEAESLTQSIRTKDAEITAQKKTAADFALELQKAREGLNMVTASKDAEFTAQKNLYAASAQELQKTKEELAKEKEGTGKLKLEVEGLATSKKGLEDELKEKYYSNPYV